MLLVLKWGMKNSRKKKCYLFIWVDCYWKNVFLVLSKILGIVNIIYLIYISILLVFVGGVCEFRYVWMLLEVICNIFILK